MLSTLPKNQVRVVRHDGQCSGCNAHVDFYSDVGDEGFGLAATLCENEFGREVFYYHEEDSAHLGPPSDRIIALNEAFAREEEKIKIRRRQPVAAMCPQCGSRNIRPSGVKEEVFIEAYEIVALK